LGLREKHESGAINESSHKLLPTQGRSEGAMTSEVAECLNRLRSQRLTRIDDLPDAIGIYALADHLGAIHYIGSTSATSFRDRIYQRHVNGSEERSHKLACNYSIGRMYRDRKCAYYVPRDAKIAKDLRREFIRRHCLVACVPLKLSKRNIETLEKEVIRIAPSDLISWNGTRARVNRLPEPRELVDALIEDLQLTSDECAALERQARLFHKYGNLTAS
jgi:hypothetical protein